MRSTSPQQRAILQSVAADLREVTELRRRSSQKRPECTAILLTADVGVELIVRAALEGTGLEVYPATTAAEAAMTARAPFVRLFVLDQRVDGAIAVVRAAAARAAPIIAIVADDQQQRLAQEAGAAATFAIPVLDAAELRMSVRWLLGGMS